MANEYQNGQIYMIINFVNDIVYIGSTTKELDERMQRHISDSKTQTTSFYTAMKTFGYDKFKIVLMKDHPCNNKKELLDQESETIKILHQHGVELYNIMYKNKTEECYKTLLEKNKTIANDVVKCLENRKLDVSNAPENIKDELEIIKMQLDVHHYNNNQILKLIYGKKLTFDKAYTNLQNMNDEMLNEIWKFNDLSTRIAIAVGV